MNSHTTIRCCCCAPSGVVLPLPITDARRDSNPAWGEQSYYSVHDIIRVGDRALDSGLVADPVVAGVVRVHQGAMYGVGDLLGASPLTENTPRGDPVAGDSDPLIALVQSISPDSTGRQPKRPGATVQPANVSLAALGHTGEEPAASRCR